MSTGNQLWYVRIDNDNVHPATLEQIDEAFNAGAITEDTLVLAAGGTEWKRLGELAGLDEAPASAAMRARVVNAAPAKVDAPPPPATPRIVPGSLRALSVDIDLDEAALRPKSRKKLVGAMLGLAAVVACGLAFAVTRAGGYAAPAVAAAAPPPPPAVAPVVAPADPPPAIAASGAGSDPAGSRLSDEQRARLLAADKAHGDQAKSKRTPHGAGAHHKSHSSYKSQGFTTGGNKYDPLNAAF